jgi:hypothetical protein
MNEKRLLLIILMQAICRSEQYEIEEQISNNYLEAQMPIKDQRRTINFNLIVKTSTYFLRGKKKPQEIWFFIVYILPSLSIIFPVFCPIVRLLPFALQTQNVMSVKVRASEIPTTIFCGNYV